MANDDPRDWMWGEALSMLARAERLHRRVFQPLLGRERLPEWAPPVDVLENDTGVLILAALPGVTDADVTVAIEDDDLVLRGERRPPEEFRRSVVHRLEVPYGFFSRRVPLPPGRYDQVSRTMLNGCLAVTLRKAGAAK